MARKRETTPANFDPNEPLALAELTAELEAEGDELPVPEPEPALSWRELDRLVLATANGEDIGLDGFEKLEMAGIRNNVLDGEQRRLSKVAHYRRMAVTPPQLKHLQQIAAETAQRVEGEIQSEEAAFAKVKAAHEARLRALQQERDAADERARLALQARDELRQRAPNPAQKLYRAKMNSIVKHYHERTTVAESRLRLLEKLPTISLEQVRTMAEQDGTEFSSPGVTGSTALSELAEIRDRWVHATAAELAELRVQVPVAMAERQRAEERAAECRDVYCPKCEGKSN